jgi:hypothetical protein
VAEEKAKLVKGSRNEKQIIRIAPLNKDPVCCMQSPLK